MKKIVQYLLDYLKREFHLGIFLLTAFLISGGIYLRYALEWDTYFIGQDYRPLKGFIFYAVPYLSVFAIIAYYKRDRRFLMKPRFWLASLLILFVLTANQHLLIYEPFLTEFHPDLKIFLSKVGYNLFTALVYLILPLSYFILLKENKSCYGFTLKGFDYKPYVIMLILMLPLLIWASYQASFLEVYPRYTPSNAEAYLQVSSYVTIGCFEASYILQFIFLELFFRGFMVMEMEKHVGGLAVLPMVVVYAFIHFGKPMPETLGSIFGGFILGVLALKSRSVFGGICIHVGIALLMELLAYFQM